MLKGFATAEGTLEYAQKFGDSKEFYIKHNGIVFSKLGLGLFCKILFLYILSSSLVIESNVTVFISTPNLYFQDIYNVLFLKFQLKN
jgi:hypothetical protein